MADCMSEEEQSPQVVSKRKKSSEHQWADSDVRDLIYMWQQEECLYNTQKKRIIIILPSLFHIKITSSY